MVAINFRDVAIVKETHQSLQTLFALTNLSDCDTGRVPVESMVIRQASTPPI